MFQSKAAFSGFAVNDLAAAKKFYGETLGIGVEETPEGGLKLQTGGNGIFIYQKDNHEPATYTILNFPVDDIEQAASELEAKGISLEHYEGMTDEKGIARGIAAGLGPDIAWFKDPAGNVLSILQQA